MTEYAAAISGRYEWYYSKGPTCCEKYFKKIITVASIGRQNVLRYLSLDSFPRTSLSGSRETYFAPHGGYFLCTQKIKIIAIPEIDSVLVVTLCAFFEVSSVNTFFGYFLKLAIYIKTSGGTRNFPSRKEIIKLLLKIFLTQGSFVFCFASSS